MPSRKRLERLSGSPTRGSEVKAPYPWEGIGHPGDWTMTERQFLAFAYRELGPERAAAALADLAPGGAGEGGEA